jgi:putative nucleotidyltransferase with HDIG domain
MQAETTLRDEVLAKAETLKALPSLNTILNELLRIMNDKNSSFSQLHNVIRYDQSISSKIISIANSAYYSRGTHIVSMERAMIVIGFDEIKNIVMCLAFLKEILNRWKLKQEDLKVLWTHSVRVGYTARALSNNLMIEEPEKAFTVSILHDIGKVIFYLFSEEYRRLLIEARETKQDICKLEKEKFGIDHQEVGYYMAIKWRFPEEFSEVIRGHHGGPDGKSELLHLVTVADAFVTNGHYPGPEGMVLEKERDRIMADAQRISELLGVVNAGE